MASASNARYETKARTLKSCEQCRARKIRCDLQAKNAEKKNEKDSNHSHSHCSPCSRQGLDCTTGAAFTKVKLRQGKRIQALRGQQTEPQSEQSRNHSISSPASSSISSYSSSSSSSPLATQSFSGSNNDSTISNEKRSWKGKGKQKEPGMFGVNGLTREFLDASLSAFFSWVSPATPMVRPEVFIPRLKLLIKQYSGETMLKPNENLIDSESEPLKLTLLLAVVITGLAYVQSTPGISDELVNNRFEIQEEMFQFFLSIIKEDDGARLVSEGLDGLEAVFILYSTSHLWNGTDGFRRRDIFQTTVRLSASSSKPFLISPLSMEGLVEIVKVFGLDSEPIETQPDGKILSRREIIRRSRAFWSIWCADALSSFSNKTTPIISDDSFEIEPPCWGPKLSKEAEYDGMGEPVSKGSKSSSSPSFDSLWIWFLLRISFQSRACAARFVTPRIKKNGILVGHCLEALDLYKRTRDEFPEILKWKSKLVSNNVESVKVSPNTPIFKRRLKSLQLELMMRYHLLAIQSAVNLAGLKEETIEFQQNHDSSLPAFPILSDLNTFSFSSNNSKTLSSRGTAKCYQTLDQLECLTSKAFEEVVSMVKEGAEEGLLRGAAAIFRLAPCYFTQWALSKVLNSINGGTMNFPEAQNLLEGASSLINSVKTIDSKGDNEVVVKFLEESFSKVNKEFDRIKNLSIDSGGNQNILGIKNFETSSSFNEVENEMTSVHNVNSSSNSKEILDEDFLNQLMGYDHHQGDSIQNNSVGAGMGGSLALSGNNADLSMEWLQRLQFREQDSPSFFSNVLEDDWFEELLK